jgi:hypothetical protein
MKETLKISKNKQKNERDPKNEKKPQKMKKKI